MRFEDWYEDSDDFTKDDEFSVQIRKEGLALVAARRAAKHLPGQLHLFDPNEGNPNF